MQNGDAAVDVFPGTMSDDQPLSRWCGDLYREGFANGSMATFSSVVEKTSALKVDDPRSTIEEYLETIGELESLNGFNGKVVSDRLKTLLSLKTKHDELHNQSHEIGRRIGEHTVEASKFDEEIDEINKQLRELEEKRSLVMSIKELKKSEITFFENKVLVWKEDMSAAQSDFEKLACSPWQV